MQPLLSIIIIILYTCSQSKLPYSHQRVFFFWFFYSLASPIVLFHSTLHIQPRLILLKQSGYVICFSKKRQNMYFSIISPYSWLGWGKALSAGRKGPLPMLFSLTKMLLFVHNVSSYLKLQIKHQFLKDVTSPMTRSEFSDMLIFFRILTSFFMCPCLCAYVLNNCLCLSPFISSKAWTLSDCWL